MFCKYVPDTSQELSLSLDSMKGCQDWLDNEIISIDAFFSMISMYQEPNKSVFSRVAEINWRLSFQDRVIYTDHWSGQVLPNSTKRHFNNAKSALSARQLRLFLYATGLRIQMRRLPCDSYICFICDRYACFICTFLLSARLSVKLLQARMCPA